MSPPFALSSETPMLSYIDPGAGSMILQALAGGVAGAMVVGKLYWSRIKRALRFGRSESSADEPRP
jgi:hypothetical protein